MPLFIFSEFICREKNLKNKLNQTKPGKSVERKKMMAVEQQGR